MMCKLAFAALAFLCVAQVMASPAVHTKPELVKPAKFNKGLFEDILAAVAAVEALVDNAKGLYSEIEGALNYITVDIVNQVNVIIAKLGELGVSQEEIDALVALVETSIANVEAIITGILDDINGIIALLGQIGDDIFSNPFALIQHVQDLIAAVGKLETDVTTALDRIVAEAKALEAAIMAAIDGMFGQPVDEIIAAIEGIYNGLLGHYNAVVNALNSTIASAEAAIAAIEKVISNLGRRH